MCCGVDDLGLNLLLLMPLFSPLLIVLLSKRAAVFPCCSTGEVDPSGETA
jgi:hypothetical protein